MLDRVQTTIRLPEELRDAVQRQAEKEGQSFNTMVILLLEKGLQVCRAAFQNQPHSK